MGRKKNIFENDETNDTKEYTFGGAISKHKIISDGLLKVLKEYGNTLMTRASYKRCIRSIHRELYGVPLCEKPKEGMSEEEEKGPRIEKCKEYIENEISKACGFNVRLRYSPDQRHKDVDNVIWVDNGFWVIEKI